jgi:succinoglycan biosynthesis protein ExoO
MRSIVSMPDPALLRTLARIEDAALLSHQERLARYFVDKKDPGGVTVFIPNWNQRTYLPRSLGSALRALNSLHDAGYEGEVILADDSSRDGSQQLARSVEFISADRRLSTLFLPANVGLPRLRNLALRLARYRYLLFLDADNELAYANLPIFLTAIRDTRAALAYGNLLDRDDQNIVGLRSNMMATMKLFDENYIDAFALCDASQLLTAGGYVTYPQLYGWEDWELILHLANSGFKMIFVPAVMGYYSVGRRSMLSETNARAAERIDLMRRIHTPTGPLQSDRRKLGRIYHPAVGFLENEHVSRSQSERTRSL